MPSKYKYKLESHVREDDRVWNVQRGNNREFFENLMSLKLTNYYYVLYEFRGSRWVKINSSK